MENISRARKRNMGREERNVKNKSVICIRIPYDKEKVTGKLKQKKYDDIFLRGRGRIDDFIGFLYESGFYPFLIS